MGREGVQVGADLLVPPEDPETSINKTRMGQICIRKIIDYQSKSGRKSVRWKADSDARQIHERETRSQAKLEKISFKPILEPSKSKRIEPKLESKSIG